MSPGISRPACRAAADGETIVPGSRAVQVTILVSLAIRDLNFVVITRRVPGRRRRLIH
jgi:hypothetical protein